MPETRFKSDAFEAMHSAVSGLYSLRIINKQAMREFEEACINAAADLHTKDIAPQKTKMGSSKLPIDAVGFRGCFAPPKNNAYHRRRLT